MNKLFYIAIAVIVLYFFLKKENSNITTSGQTIGGVFDFNIGTNLPDLNDPVA